MSISALAASIAASEKQPGLWSYPPARPLPKQREIVDRAIADARAAGLVLPTFRLHFVSAGYGPPTNGQTRRGPDGRIDMWLNVDISPGQLRWTGLHECRHVHDLAAGWTGSRLQLEQRACDFANRHW